MKVSEVQIFDTDTPDDEQCPVVYFLVRGRPMTNDDDDAVDKIIFTWHDEEGVTIEDLEYRVKQWLEENGFEFLEWDSMHGGLSFDLAMSRC
jgi:hypothetical protein